MVYTLFYLPLYDCTGADLQQVQLVCRPVRFTAHVTEQSVAGYRSRFLHFKFVQLRRGWCRPDVLLRENVLSYCPVAVIAFF